MRKWISWIFVMCLLAHTIPLHTAYAETNLPIEDTHDTPDYAEGEVLVTLSSPHQTELTKEGTTSLDDSIEVEQSWNFGTGKKDSGQNSSSSDNTVYISQVSSDRYSTDELIDELEDQPYVLSVEPNYYRHKMSGTTEPLYQQQWYLDGNGAFKTSSAGIHYKESTALSHTSESVVAIVDTGIDYTHEDLASHMWVNPYASYLLEGTYGYDFGDSDADPMDDDEDGHGTHCAGVVSAVSDNQTGISGISDSKLMALKIFDSKGDAKDSFIIDAFNYIYRAQSLGVNISAINCSWGGGGSTPASIRTLIEKIGARGSLFVFAAGNDGTNHDNSRQQCPYDINSDYIVITGATNQQDKRASFSDYGKNSVHLFAPGDLIFSTVNEGVFSPSTYSAKQREQLCTFYTPYDSYDTTIYTAPEVGLSSRSMFYLGKSYSKEDFYNNDASGSLCVSIRSLRNAATVELYLDVTKLALDRSKTYHLCYDLGLKEDGIVSWDHYFVKSTPNHFVTQDNRTYLRLVGLSGNFRQTSELYFDNLGISKANLETQRFGKYTAMSGTSMAAPQVTAAVALLSSVYPHDTATDRRARLFNCVRQTEALSPYCMTGGILDLSKIATASNISPLTTKQEKKTEPVQENTVKKSIIKVEKIKLNKKKATLRYGKKLKLKATITPKNAKNKKVKWYVSNKKYAKVTQKGVVKAKKKGIGHTIKVYAKAKDQSGKKTYCKVRIKKRKA